uniref:Uncharacterized protein n=1 Tax=Nelumbo nucifera TaxID=4432 RepID=A0A822YU24_NELNU|nr:TPA_asm: hypothetical protein HUJ06_008245 [Nelumbo nucifera]
MLEREKTGGRERGCLQSLSVLDVLRKEAENYDCLRDFKFVLRKEAENYDCLRDFKFVTL